MSGNRSLYVQPFVWPLVFAVLLIAISSITWGDIPRKINYQGRLEDSSSGEPLTGSHTMTFRIYDQASGGTLLWSETQVLEADLEGVVSATLGTTVPLSLLFEEPAWLEVEVNSEILLPRREIVAVPYAFRAMDADSLGGYPPTAYLMAGDVGSVDSDMIADGEITDDDVSGDAAIDPGKISGTAWTSTNDGTGSGLDADMVDGLNADAFADTGHTHDDIYRRKEELQTGGTINFSMNPVDWTKLKNVPAGFADGTDDVGGAGDGHSLDAADGSMIDVVYVNNAGNVGIGTSNPTQGKVEVLTGSTTGIHSATGSGIGVLGWSASGTGVKGISSTGRAGVFDGDVYVNGQVGIGDATPSTSLDVIGEAYVSNRLGIGTDNPAVALDVEGAISADSVYMIRDQPLLTASRTSTILGIGASATRISLDNTIIGYEAGYNAVSGRNTFVGTRAGYGASLVSSENTCVGAYAGEGLDTGEDNTFVGSRAGRAADGPGNTFVGARVAEMCPSSGGNTFVGAYTARNLEFGSHNVCVGYWAGSSMETAHRNVFIGYYAGANEMGSDKLYIANDSDTSGTLIYGDFSSGRIGLGTLNPERKLHIRGNNPRILIDAYASNPEINFKNKGDAGSQMWAVYKDAVTGDLGFYRDGDRVRFEPDGDIYCAGDIHCTGKLTSDGGIDPPYVLYDKETRQAIIERVAREVPDDKLDGAVLFWNGDESRFEVYLPSKGEFRDLMGNLLAKASDLGHRH
jgi:hypothetical protein